jgi:hypothetical protein
VDIFNEHSDEAVEIMEEIEETLGYMEFYFLVSFKEPYHDIARRFLNEIVEFEPLEED